MQEQSGSTSQTAMRGSAGEVLAVFLRLGLTSFGGPIAHLGSFHDEFVVRWRWLDQKTYVDLVLFGYGVSALHNALHSGWVRGLSSALPRAPYSTEYSEPCSKDCALPSTA